MGTNTGARYEQALQVSGDLMERSLRGYTDTPPLHFWWFFCMLSYRRASEALGVHQADPRLALMGRERLPRQWA